MPPTIPPGYENGTDGRAKALSLFFNSEFHLGGSEFQFGDNVSSEYGTGIIVSIRTELIGIKIVYWNEAVPVIERRCCVYIKKDDLKKI